MTKKEKVVKKLLYLNDKVVKAEKDLIKAKEELYNYMERM